MSRNQKATVLMSGMYAAAVVSGLIGGLMPSETRITGTIKSRTVNIPIWLQKEPEYAKLEGAKVSGGWMGGKIFMFVVGAGFAGVGLVLSSERQKELEKEAIEEAIALKLFEETAKLNAAAQATLTQQILTVQGQAKFSIAESQVIDDFNAIRESNGWLPSPTVVAEIAPTSASASPVINQLPPLRSPAEYAAEAKSGLKEKLAEPVKIGDEAIAPYRKNAEKILNSLAGIQTSIFMAAPTRAGKTYTLYKWLKDVLFAFSKADIYVISQKKESYCGLDEKGRVDIFDPMNPMESLANLVKVYEILQKRKGSKFEDGMYDNLPVKLILEDWFASLEILQQKSNSKIWDWARPMLSMIVTVGGQYNVGYYICTQTFNIEGSGVSDSNIRLNLALIAQGLVRTNNKGQQQGNYGVLQQMIGNPSIVPDKKDRDRLSEQLRFLIEASEKEQTPIIFSAIGEPILGLMPHIQRNTNSNTVELPNDNPFKLAADDRTYEQRLWDMEFNLSGISAYPDTPQEDAPIDDIASSQPPDTSDTDTLDTSKPEWLPDRETILEMAAETSRCFSEFVKKELKSSRGDRYKTTREFVTKLIIESGNLVLINKFNLGE